MRDQRREYWVPRSIGGASLACRPDFASLVLVKPGDDNGKLLERHPETSPHNTLPLRQHKRKSATCQEISPLRGRASNATRGEEERSSDREPRKALRQPVNGPRGEERRSRDRDWTNSRTCSRKPIKAREQTQARRCLRKARMPPQISWSYSCSSLRMRSSILSSLGLMVRARRSALSAARPLPRSFSIAPRPERAPK